MIVYRVNIETPSGYRINATFDTAEEAERLLHKLAQAVETKGGLDEAVKAAVWEVIKDSIQRPQD